MSLHVTTLNTATNLRSQQYLNVVGSNKVSDKGVIELARLNLFDVGLIPFKFFTHLLLQPCLAEPIQIYQTKYFL